jgi:hypothetical protein
VWNAALGRWCRQIQVNGGTLQHRVSQPFMNKAQICAGADKVSGNAVFQYVEVALLYGQLGFSPVLFHKPVETSTSDGMTAYTQEKGL